jgi:class 3 adenylate cyclase
MTARVVERRVVTVLFADLVGFTSLSERLDAEDVSLIQDAYFEAVRETIERDGGMLEKFVGDAAMAPGGRHATFGHFYGGSSCRSSIVVTMNRTQVSAASVARRAWRGFRPGGYLGRPWPP